MPILYTDAATVAASINLNPEASLSGQIGANVQTLPLSVVPTTWQPGMFLALDYFNPGVREVVQITGPATGTSVPITATTYAHVNGAPLVECSGINDWIAAATSAVDDFCYMRVPGAFAQQTLTETIKAYIDNEGFLVIPCSLPNPQVNSVTALSYQSTPVDPVVTFALPPKAWAESRYFLKVGNAQTDPSYTREVMATLTYTGGYYPLPADIQRATVALAARFYKEKDSGFSDTIGTNDMGIMTFKKAMPADIKMMLRPHVRYV